jgi:hypothetical protein
MVRVVAGAITDSNVNPAIDDSALEREVLVVRAKVAAVRRQGRHAIVGLAASMPDCISIAMGALNLHFSWRLVSAQVFEMKVRTY